MMAVRRFVFARDTFAFANELIWEYRLDPATGRMRFSRPERPPAYTHRCFVMVRAARQFFYHARFEPARPVAEGAVYRRLIRQVITRSPRRVSAESERVVIPGYDGLRAFSQAQEPLLKAGCGAPWESYFLRSHWRMVFPVWRRHQERTAQRLKRSLGEGRAPVVHLFCFPRITINHGMVLFGAADTEQGVQFDAYDPNIPEHPLQLAFEGDRRTFSLAQTHYYAGGPLNVVEIFRNAIY